MKLLGQAMAILLSTAFPVYAGDFPTTPIGEMGSSPQAETFSEALSGTSVPTPDVPGLDPADVAAELNQPTNLEPVPGRPTRSEDEAAELDPRGDDSEAEDEIEEMTTLLGEPWHQLGPITGEYFYTGEVFSNTHGGISTKGATRYRGNLDLSLRLDTAAAHWWDGGEFYVYMQQSHGTTLTPEFVGDGQYYSNIDTGTKPQSLTQLGEYWYGHTFGENLLIVRAGRHDPNNDFAFADLGSDFINSSFVTLPNIPMPFWPFQTLGVTALYQPHEKWRLGAAANDQGRDIGQWWATTTSRGMFYIAQADYLPLADVEDSPLTILRAGAWGSSSDTAAVDASGGFENNYGFYATIDRMLFRESHSFHQGLGIFFQYCWAPSDRNQVDQGVGGGLVYTGLLPDRDIDTLGVGFSQIQFSPELEPITGQTSEVATEVFYKVRVNDWCAIIPDLQYIARPYGLYSDAMVAGFRFEVNL